MPVRKSAHPGCHISSDGMGPRAEVFSRLCAVLAMGRAAMRYRWAVVAALAPVLADAAAAQQAPVRVRGEIEKVDGNTLTVKARDGNVLTIAVTRRASAAN